MILTKAAATVTPVESEHPNGEFDVILSTDDLDRDGDNLHADEWKQPLPDHITFDSDHGMSVATTVGSGKPFLNDDGQLQVRGTYASTDHAQATRKLVSEGHIRHVSVAYLERKSKGEGGPKPERELLNGAFVAVPANPKAVVLMSKSLQQQRISVATKAIAGSVQDLENRICDAVRGLYGDQEYPWVRATFLDGDGSSGTVVYEVGAETLARSFTDDGTECAIGSDVRAVSLITTLVDNATATDNKSSSHATTAGQPQESAEKSAAPGAADEQSAVPAADDSADAAVLRARALAVSLSATALSADMDTD